MIEIEGSLQSIFLMKFRWKDKFQGPPSFEVHHLTALSESDSTMIFFISIRWELAAVIWKARNVAFTSALFISIGGIGVEKRQIKSPLEFLKTPPIAERFRRGLKEASTFH